MASKKRKSISDPNAAAVLTKTKQRSLVDNQLNSIANKAKNDLENNNPTNVVDLANAVADSNIDNDNSNLDSNLNKNKVDKTNDANNVGGNADNALQNVQKQNDNNEAIDSNDNQLNEDAESNANEVNADANNNKVKWVKDKNGNRVKEAELKVLKAQWEAFTKHINKNEPNGIDINDKTYFPTVDWDSDAKVAKKEYKGFDVDTLASTWGDVVGKKKNLMLMSEPHSNKKSGFTLARKIIADTKPPGVLMLEAPAALNQSPDIVKALGYWGFWKARNSNFGALAKEAKEKGWKIVAVDATNPDNGSVNTDLMTDADMPKDLISKGSDEPAVGSKSRQSYIARNVLNSIEDNPNVGSVVLIGTAHIVSSEVPDLSPMISKTKTSNAPSQASFDETNSRGKLVKNGRPFRIVEVDTDNNNLRTTVDNDPK